MALVSERKNCDGGLFLHQCLPGQSAKYPTVYLPVGKVNKGVLINHVHLSSVHVSDSACVESVLINAHYTTPTFITYVHNIYILCGL